MMASYSFADMLGPPVARATRLCAATARSPFSVDEDAPERAAQARRPAARELGRSEREPDAQEPADADPAQGLRLPAREGRADEGEPHELALAREDQVGERAPREVRGRHALSDVAPRPADAP